MASTKASLALLFISTLLLQPSFAIADGESGSAEPGRSYYIVPTLSTGIYSFDYKSSFGDLSVSPLFYDVGIAFVHPRIAVNAHVINVLDDEDDLNQVFGEVTHSRREYEIVFSVPVTEQLSLTAGYRESDLEIESKEFRSNIGVPPGTYTQKYDEGGLFLGGAYKWRFKRGNLTASAAYASFDSEITDNMDLGEDSLDAFGDLTGYSITLQWLGAINQRVGYSATFTLRKYELDSTVGASLDEIPGLGPVNEESFDVDWDVRLISAGLYYIF